jgi:hypothetical protein
MRGFDVTAVTGKYESVTVFVFSEDSSKYQLYQ